MYAFGSVGCVGSWFFISATSRVRKSFADMVVEAVEADDEVLLSEVPPVVAAALGLVNPLATLLAELAICGALVTIC
jgi:hypothetical protein